ncbi:MAG: acylneuraminate cytidylyltransferase family protein [bacterium]|jgi:CMP-N-acetylneuraminic acid synthetase|nr:acylneuraminate cytidylyltransferase family protein [bacterium]
MIKPTPIAHTLAIIPARGGSKGLPRKNVRLLGGIPLIAYTIRAALHSRVERVIVSTDDEEIASVARQAGAEVPFLRPADYSTDQATSLSVLLHALDFMETKLGYHPRHILFLQPTSPFRTAHHVDEALDRYLSIGTASLISVTEVQEFHPYFMFRIQPDGMMKPLIELEQRPLRRQDLPPFYRINGAIYISCREYYHNLPADAAIFDWNHIAAYPMDAPSSVDINDYLDFQKAELLLKQEMEQGE